MIKNISLTFSFFLFVFLFVFVPIAHGSSFDIAVEKPVMCVDNPAQIDANNKIIITNASSDLEGVIPSMVMYHNLTDSTTGASWQYDGELSYNAVYPPPKVKNGSWSFAIRLVTSQNFGFGNAPIYTVKFIYSIGNAKNTVYVTVKDNQKHTLSAADCGGSTGQVSVTNTNSTNSSSGTSNISNSSNTNGIIPKDNTDYGPCLDIINSSPTSNSASQSPDQATMKAFNDCMASTTSKSIGNISNQVYNQINQNQANTIAQMKKITSSYVQDFKNQAGVTGATNSGSSGKISLSVGTVKFSTNVTSTMSVGDAWNITVTGLNANETIYATGGKKIGGGFPSDKTPYTANASGVVSLSGVHNSSVVGDWSLVWTRADGTVLNTMIFTVKDKTTTTGSVSNNSNQTSAYRFSPTSGLVDTTVTVNATGMSFKPLNTIKFGVYSIFDIAPTNNTLVFRVPLQMYTNCRQLDYLCFQTKPYEPYALYRTPAGSYDINLIHDSGTTYLGKFTVTQ